MNLSGLRSSGSSPRRQLKTIVNWFAPLAVKLSISGFAEAGFESYDLLQDWQDEALAAGYAEPG